jgi:hypothetical protein
MNKLQKEIVYELKKKAKELGHSPKRREISKLALKCYSHFNSFNQAKKLAGLNIVNVRVINFPKNAFDFDKDLARIIAFLTADGHLYKSLRGFLFYSNNKTVLKELEDIIFKKFGLIGTYSEGTGYGKCFRYRVFNKKISLFLKESGSPIGDKMLTSFDVPDWIKDNKEFSREYLKTLFYCEGSKSKHSKNTEIIRINFNKAEILLKDGLTFINSIKKLLERYAIETSEIWITKGNIRKKDREITKQITFQIKSNSNNKFIKEIGWLK